jgi:hypothetical protein
LRKTILALMAVAVVGLGYPTAASARDSGHGGGWHAGWAGHRGWAGYRVAGLAPGFYGSPFGYFPIDGGYYGYGGYYNVPSYGGGCFRTWQPVMTPYGTRIQVVVACE